MKRHVPRAVASQLSESRPQGGGGQLRWPLAAPAGPHETGLPGENAIAQGSAERTISSRAVDLTGEARAALAFGE